MNALFTAILAEVYTKTKRPDLVEASTMAVKAATLKLHQADFYAKDLLETGIEFVVPAFFQSLEYRTLFPRYRKLEYLRKYDASGATPGDFFTILTPAQSLDSYGINKEDVCYLGGASIEIRSTTEDSHMLIGLFLNPYVTVDEYDSWIALDHPYAIVLEAARQVLSGIGLEERAARIEKEAIEAARAITVSNI